jgi:molybdopterin molybdotransferase
MNDKSHASGDEHGRSDVGFKNLTPISQALQIVFRNLPKKATSLEKVPVSSALGRILAEDVVSEVNIPSFEKSTKDGFAVIAEDTHGAIPSSPVLLRTVGAVQIGTIPELRVVRGDAVSIVTGGNMPEGANAVVMVEDTRRVEDGKVQILEEVSASENVTHVGDDVKKGGIILKRGARVLPQDIGMLACIGSDQVVVKSSLRVGVLSTGTELQRRPVDSLGKISDVNRPMLISAVRELGCEPVDLGIVADDYEEIHGRLEEGIKTVDVMLVTAGTSVGPADLVPKAINSLAKPGMLVHGVAMRPAMPTGLAVANGKPIVSLPGFPVSAYIAFLELARPVIAYLLGIELLPRPTVKAQLSSRVSGAHGFRTYVRVHVTIEGKGYAAEPVKASSSAILSSLVYANGFVIIPEDVEGYEDGEEVDVELFRPPEYHQAAT